MSLVPRCFAVLLASVLVIAPALATAESIYYVAPDGQANNAGTKESPWDIESTWGGQHEIEPGATVLMLGGIYRHPDRSWDSPGFYLTLQGTSDKPITIRPATDQRVTIDGKVEVKPGCHDVHVWELEITVAETASWSRAVTAGGLKNNDSSIQLPQGGLNILGGANSKFINLVIHDMSNGVGLWRPAVDAEMHGCLIYKIGSIGPDRYHGPGIYTQNEIGSKLLTDNILFGNYSTTIQAYGSSKASVSGFTIRRNIAFAPVKEGRREQVLVGGGQPSRDIVVSDNILYEVPLQIGYTAPYNVNAEVKNNWLVDASMSINNFEQVVDEGNMVFDDTRPRPDRPVDQMLHLNRYDANRANLVVLNWQRQSEVPADLSAMLDQGDRYRILNALDFYGAPAATGTFAGEPVLLPMLAEERTGQGEIGVFVVLREDRG